MKICIWNVYQVIKVQDFQQRHHICCLLYSVLSMLPVNCFFFYYGKRCFILLVVKTRRCWNVPLLCSRYSQLCSFAATVVKTAVTQHFLASVFKSAKMLPFVYVI